MGVGLNISNERPSTCIDAQLRKRARELGVADHPSLSLKPEVPFCILQAPVLAAKGSGTCLLLNLRVGFCACPPCLLYEQIISNHSTSQLPPVEASQPVGPLPLLKSCAGCGQLLLADTLARLERFMGTLQRQGFEPMAAAYTAAWLHSDQQVGSQRPEPHANALRTNEPGSALTDPDKDERVQTPKCCAALGRAVQQHRGRLEVHVAIMAEHSCAKQLCNIEANFDGIEARNLMTHTFQQFKTERKALVAFVKLCDGHGRRSPLKAQVAR